MRRDDLRKVVLIDSRVRRRKGTTATFANVSDAEALDAIGRDKALKHWLTDPCPFCTTRYMTDCRTCGGRGWKPKEGVKLVETWPKPSGLIGLTIPLSMLEGDDQ